MVFVDLTKAFTTLSPSDLWKILHRCGCPERLVSLIKSFHDGMQTRLQENGETSKPFPVRNGVKQGCILTSTHLSILFAAVLANAFGDFNQVVYIQF